MMKPRIAMLLMVLALMMPIGAHAQRGEMPPWVQPLPPARTTAEIVVGETPLMVELALTSPEQSLGLGYRNGLDTGTGMLFVFPEAGERVFWMKGMRMCLDIIWIVEGEIVGAAENACPDPDGTEDSDRQRFPSELPVTHVLEVPSGWLQANGYGVGTPVEIPAGL